MHDVDYGRPRPLQTANGQPAHLRSVGEAAKALASQNALGVQKQYKLMEKVRSVLHSRGGTTFKHLQRQFQIMDDSGDQKLQPSEFKKGLCDLGMRHFPISDEEWLGLFRTFDSDGSGTLSMCEFLKAVRGSLKCGTSRGLDPPACGSVHARPLPCAHPESRGS